MTKREIKKASDKKLAEREWQLNNGAVEDFEGEYSTVCREADDRYFGSLSNTFGWADK